MRPVRTVLIVDDDLTQPDTAGIVAERVELLAGDVLVIRGKGRTLTGDEARDYQISQLERQLDRCHELVDALHQCLGQCAIATSMTQISTALAEYAGIPDSLSPDWGKDSTVVRSAWNTVRRRPWAKRNRRRAT